MTNWRGKILFAKTNAKFYKSFRFPHRFIAPEPHILQTTINRYVILLHALLSAHISLKHYC